MRRRDFIKGVANSAAAWPLAARAQQQPMPVIGFLNSGSQDGSTSQLKAFHRGLKEAGYVEGHNVAIEYRWADGAYEKLSGLATELVGRGLSVMFAGGPPAAVAAKAATSTIPIIFTSGGDPVELGFVSTLNKPGGNVTGVSFLFDELSGKRLELLHELVPAATEVGFLVNPTRPRSQSEVDDALRAARTLGLKLVVLSASNEVEIDKAFSVLSQQGITALLVGTDLFFVTRRDRLVALANRFNIATMYSIRDYVAACGLISYAPSVAEGYRQAGLYVAKILNGAKPSNLPVLQPTKFDLVINLKTAKALGLTISSSMQLLADELIE
jgi:putative ABC transport system substrate-binding protein